MDSAMGGSAHEPFGEMSDGIEVTRYALTNRCGSVARLIDLGATLTELWRASSARRREGLGQGGLAGTTVVAGAGCVPPPTRCTLPRGPALSRRHPSLRVPDGAAQRCTTRSSSEHRVEFLERRLGHCACCNRRSAAPVSIRYSSKRRHANAPRPQRPHPAAHPGPH
jgi:hypothetical protein